MSELVSKIDPRKAQGYSLVELPNSFFGAWGPIAFHMLKDPRLKAAHTMIAAFAGASIDPVPHSQSNILLHPQMLPESIVAFLGDDGSVIYNWNFIEGGEKLLWHASLEHKEQIESNNTVNRSVDFSFVITGDGQVNRSSRLSKLELLERHMARNGDKASRLAAFFLDSTGEPEAIIDHRGIDRDMGIKTDLVLRTTPPLVNALGLPSVLPSYPERIAGEKTTDFPVRERAELICEQRLEIEDTAPRVVLAELEEYVVLPESEESNSITELITSQHVSGSRRSVDNSKFADLQKLSQAGNVNFPINYLYTHLLQDDSIFYRRPI